MASLILGIGSSEDHRRLDEYTETVARYTSVVASVEERMSRDEWHECFNRCVRDLLKARRRIDELEGRPQAMPTDAGVRLLSRKLAHAMGREREWNERDGIDLTEHGWLTQLLQDVATVRLDHYELTTRPPDDHKVEATNLRMMLVDVAAALGLHLSPGAPLGAFAALPAKVRQAVPRIVTLDATTTGDDR